MRDPIRPTRYLAAIASRIGRGESVSPDVVRRFDLAGEDPAIFFYTGFDPHNRRLTVRRKKNLFTAEHPLHRPMRFARQSGGQWLQARMSFRAVATADIGHDHSYFRLRQIEKHRQLRPDR